MQKSLPSISYFAILLAATVLGGCSILPGSGGSSLVVQSSAEPVALSSSFPTSAYIHSDNNTADVYLSDLPIEVLMDPAADLRAQTGQLIHIHLFLMPVAGRTPMDSTAFNFTARCVVLTGGQAGMYTGGGFIMPSEEPGGRWFSATVRDATVRLARADDGFSDRLGVSTLSGSISVRRDEDRARAIAGRIQALVAGMQETPTPE